MQTATQNLSIQKKIAALSIVLFIIKMAAYILTHSVAILTDALESIVNIVAGLLGIYSLIVSARPKDSDHPYGHGKVEFISAAIEGTLIFVAGLLIIYGATKNLFVARIVHQLDWGIALIVVTAIVNYIAGIVCERIGIKNNSLPLIASGKHLKSDTYTTAGIIIGLILLYFTNIYWIDSVVAILFACIISYTGYKIIRSSIAGIMDEADTNLLQEMIGKLNEKRSENWVDIHNLRIIKYGALLHLDAHLTVPWYFNVNEANKEIDELTELLMKKYGDSIEFFIHSDACLDFSCSICIKHDCVKRKFENVKKIQWSFENISANEKHNENTN
jgi:cation diffusion facilitator family transporter